MGTVVVVGASIAGLSAAVRLRRAGHAVRIVERADAAPTDRGAGLGVEPGLVESIVGTAAMQGLDTFVLERRLSHQAEAYDGSPPRRVDVDAAPARLHSGRVLLTGDAAHLLSPITGSGARLALHDAQSAAHAAMTARVSGWPAAAAECARAVQARADAAAASARLWAQRALGVASPTGLRAERACSGEGHAG
ncbi:MAG: hypothetical protein Fur0014_04010 [Rubrivivax sp.]